MYLIALDASLPEASAKARHLDNIEDLDGDLSSAQLKASMHWMFPPGQEALHQQFGARILGSLPELDRERDQDLVGTLTSSILPTLCTPDSVLQLSASIRDRGALSLGSTKDLRVSHQEDQRCMDMAQRQFGGLSSDNQHQSDVPE
jgi:aminopeptidase N